jgi:hypothetical protein
MFVSVGSASNAAESTFKFSGLLPIEWAIFRKFGVIWCSMEAPS